MSGASAAHTAAASGVDDITPIVDALFRYADPDSFVALRCFPQHDKGKPAEWLVDVRAGDLAALVAAIGRGIHRAAFATDSEVFSPVTGATFAKPGTAKTKDVKNGLAIAVEIDSGNTKAALARLEALLGPATLVVLSGGIWIDPATGEVHPKLHAYWRLSEPTTDEAGHVLLHGARRDAAILAGADMTGTPIAHCFRFPGSLNRKNPDRPVRCIVERWNSDAEVHLGDAVEQLALALEGAGLNGGGHKGNGAYQGKRELQADPTLVAAALACIPNAASDNPNPEAAKTEEYGRWVRMAYAVAGATGGTGFDIFRTWSAKFAAKQNEGEDKALWGRVIAAKPTKIGAGSIFHEAAQHGWIDPRRKPKAAKAEKTTASNGPAAGQGAPQTGDGPQPGIGDGGGDGGGVPPPPPPLGGPGTGDGGGGGGPLGPDPDELPEPHDGPRPGEPEQLPTIKCVAGELDRMYREAEAALLKSGLPIYQRTMLMRPTMMEYDAAPPSGSDVPRKTHSAVLIPLTAPALTKMLSRVAIFLSFYERKKQWRVCDPPPKLVDIILASRGDWRFPVVRGILTCPTLRDDGSLLKEPGYDPISRYYLSLPSDFALPDDFPDDPTRADAEASLKRLDALLDGYKFEDDPKYEGVSRACALAMLMTQTLRCAMPNSPLEAVSAKAPGTGKSHLVDLCSMIPTGRWCPIINAGKDDNETEKGINTKLISGVSAFSIDNVHKTLNLEALNTATERPLLSPRDFGVLKDIEVENGTVIRQTGNNLDVVDEQVRRTTYCRMDAKEERPEQRAFTSDPIQTVLANRSRYVADVLIIARAYHLHGWQPNIPSYGGYAKWSHFVREPLVWLGKADPIRSQDYMRKNDPAANRRTSIIDAWHGAFGMGAHTAAEAIAYATTPPVMVANYQDKAQHAINLAAYQAHKAAQEGLLGALREAFPAGTGINGHAFGNWLRRFEGRLTDGLKFVKDDLGGAQRSVARWRLSH